MNMSIADGSWAVWSWNTRQFICFNKVFKALHLHLSYSFSSLQQNCLFVVICVSNCWTICPLWAAVETLLNWNSSLTIWPKVFDVLPVCKEALLVGFILKEQDVYVQDTGRSSRTSGVPPPAPEPCTGWVRCGSRRWAGGSVSSPSSAGNLQLLSQRPATPPTGSGSTGTCCPSACRHRQLERQTGRLEETLQTDTDPGITSFCPLWMRYEQR